ncbi:MAG: thiol-disulfide oxidoreductase DCC, partial [Idiomarina sp.]|nr:thiol-disulfide oxidoreductase DCC [Idiomarina sp.]
MSQQSSELIIFFDGGCPLCVKEMRHLKRLDKEGRIQFENVNEPDFSQRYPQVDVAKANQYLHGQTSSGDMIYGLDVTHAAWSLV